MKNLCWVVLTWCTLFVSCRDKDTEVPLPGAGEQEVELALYTPLSDTRADEPVDLETEIRELDLVVCKDGKYLYTRPAYQSTYAKFRSTLKIDAGLTICFFANCRDILEEYADLFQEDEQWENIYPRLIDTRPGRLTNSPWYLPMWGQLEDVIISDEKINDLGTVSMLRSVASADVLFTLRNNEFILKEGYVFHAADRGFLVPSPANLVKENGKITGVKGPECPELMQTTLRLEVTGPEDNCLLESFYFYDNDVVSAGPVRRNQTRLVVGGHFNGNPDMTWYPLDFKFDEQILKATRNQKYRVIVTAVNGDGWDSPEEAAEAAAVNLDYDVIPWDQYTDEHIGIDGADYLSIRKKHMQLFREAGSGEVIAMSTTYAPDKLNMEFVGSYNGTSQTDTGVIRNDRFEVRLVTGADNRMTGLSFTALADYDSIRVMTNTQTLVLTAGRIRFELLIEQLDYHSHDWNDGGDEEKELG